MEKIETERLILRPFRESDYDGLFEFLYQLRDDEYEGYPGITYENGREHLKYRLNSQEFYVIELKESFAIKDLRSILAIIDREYDRKKVTFISFSYYPLGLLRQEAPSIPLQYLSQEENDPKFKACLNNGISIDVKQTILTEELVTTFHDAGLTVNVWTVNDEEDLQNALQLGVDYITTDLFHEE